jgi:hypothetical protein
MKPTRLLVATLALATSLRAVDRVPEFSITDTYATVPTMLARLGADGDIREVWSGMDAARMRHVPLFLETSIHALVLRDGRWLDLRTLGYRHEGTHPGFIRMASEDGLVSIEVRSRKRSDPCPVAVVYDFREPVDLRLSAQFKYPEFTQAAQADDAAGTATFQTLWRGVNATLATTQGPRLVLATEPAGATVSVDRTGLVKEIRGATRVILAIDATDAAPERAPGENYVAAWSRALSAKAADPVARSAADVVSLASDDARLDTLFRSSIDAIESHQFASGDVMADVFFYRDSWLRDGTYTMIGLSLAGDYASVDRYFSFWNAQRDFSVGGEREAQQAAIAITGMWFYSRLDPDGAAFLAHGWPYVKYYADYYSKRVGREGMLRLAEEWICFIPAPSSWPNAEVYSGLRASAKIAAALGHGEEQKRWSAAADALRARFSEVAYDRDKGRIIPMAGRPGETFRDPEFPGAESRNGPLRDDRTDAGMLIIGRLEAFGRGQGIVAVDDPTFASTQDEVIRDLENPDHSIFRFGPNPSSPHAPKGELDEWPIITAWAAQDEWLLGRTDLAWRYLQSGILGKDHVDMEARHYYLPEFWDPKGVPDKPLIVWSHGDFVTSVLLLFLGVDLEPEAADLGLAPSLPPGVHHAHLNRFRFRNWRLDVDLRRNGAQVDVDMKASDPAGAGPLTIRLPFGRLLILRDGQEARFTVDPSQYFVAFGRSRNAAERAAIASRVLGGAKPAKDFSRMTAPELEDYICGVETGFRPAPR